MTRRCKPALWFGGLVALFPALPTCGGEDDAGDIEYCVDSDLEADFDRGRCGDAASTDDHVIEDEAGLQALADYTRIDGSLTIEGSALTSLVGLESLRCVDGDVTIRANSALADLAGLDGLLYIGGNLTIGELSGGNPSLETTAALANLVAIEGALWIEDNDRLETLEGFADLEFVGEFLGVFDNDALTGLADWSALEHVGGFLNVADNDALPTCQAIDLRDRIPAECRNVCIRANQTDSCDDDAAGCWYTGAEGGQE
jgi:hypothetical protein